MTAYAFDEENASVYYFTTTMLALYLLPKTYRTIFPHSVPFEKQEPYSSSPEALRKAKSLKKGRQNQTNWLLLAILWVALALSIYGAFSTQDTHKMYDPFDVLGVSHSATEDDIKAAFKRLSRIYHPDKVASDKRDEANARFVEISKAYKALTDEEIRRNWEEHGNPDGIRTRDIGVALPAWMVNSNFSSVLIVLIYCLLFGTGIPIVVRRWWSRNKVYTKDGVRQMSMAIFYRELKETTSAKRVIEIISLGTEFEVELELYKGLQEDLASLESQIISSVNENFVVPKSVSGTLGARRAFLLLHSHFARLNIENPRLYQDQKFVVTRALRMVQGLLQIALARDWLPATNSCISISQYLVQAVWEGDSPLLQLPYVSRESDIKKIGTIQAIMDMDEKSCKETLKLNDEQYSDFIKVATTIPRVRVLGCSFAVLGQSSITPATLITCIVKLSLSDSPSDKLQDLGDKESGENDLDAFSFDEDGNLLDGKRTKDIKFARPIFCPRFPDEKRPVWWVSLVNKANNGFVTPPVRVHDLSDEKDAVKTVTFQFASPKSPMSVTVNLIITCDSLIGALSSTEAKFVVTPLAPSDDASSAEEWGLTDDEDDKEISFDS